MQNLEFAPQGKLGQIVKNCKFVSSECFKVIKLIAADSNLSLAKKEEVKMNKIWIIIILY
jgi:hypothetical protein